MKHNLNFSDNTPNIKGLQEVLISVSNLEKSTNFFEHICGWKKISSSSGSADLKKLWHLNDSVEIEEVVLHNDGDHEGFVRLVQFKNVEQQQIRSAANAWDTGGVFDINIRVSDINSLYKELQTEGWNGVSDPLRYTFNIYDVSEVLMKGPDGIVIAFIQRFNPPLEGFEQMKKTSRIFNSSVTVRDMEETRDFFINKLGFTLFFQTPGLDRKTGHNVIGIPPSMNQDISVPIAIVRPDINSYGSIECIHLTELKGKDFKELAHPPNLGILMHRFPVRDADSYAATLKEKGVKLNTEVQTLYVAPYGNLKVFSVRSPDGVWIEFIELID